MKARILATLIFACYASASFAAAEGKVNILSPMDGATLDSKEKSTIKFDVTPNAGGDHLHLYVDGKRVDVIHEFKGSEELDPLSPGRHRICLEVNTRAHVSTGLENCINVTAK